MCVRGLVTDSPLEVVCESVAIPRKRIKHCVPMKSNQMCLSCENSSTVIIDQSNRRAPLYDVTFGEFTFTYSTSW